MERPAEIERRAEHLRQLTGDRRPGDEARRDDEVEQAEQDERRGDRRVTAALDARLASTTRTASPPRAGMIAFTPAPANTEATIERQRTRVCGYAPLMMFRQARLTASRRRTWQAIPSASAPQANSPSRSRKTSVASQIAWIIVRSPSSREDSSTNRDRLAAQPGAGGSIARFTACRRSRRGRAPWMGTGSPSAGRTSP